MKVSKSSVDYSKGMGKSRCKNCVHFLRAQRGLHGNCELVAGSIDPEYWCEKFKMEKVHA